MDALIDQTRPCPNERASASPSFLLVTAAYFFLHLVIRVNLPDSLARDEAEAVFFSQQLHLGYGTQPPLYAWLQWLMFSAFGLNLFSLAALKNLLLLATYVCMFHAARPLVGMQGAVAASASMMLFPQIGWESQRDLTHSVLLTAIASATLCCYFAVLRNPTAIRYVVFGMLAGLGLLAKYNFAVFLAGLLCASLLIREHRQVLWSKKMATAAVIALLILLPHGLWLVRNLDMAASGTLHKMAEGVRDGEYVRNVLTGLASLMRAVLSFMAPAAVVYFLICRRYWTHASINWHNPNTRFFLALYGSFLTLLVLLVLTGEVGKIKDRWMLPLLFSLPLALLVMVPSLPKAVVSRRIVRIVAVAAVVILLAIPLRVRLGATHYKEVPAHPPYPELAAVLAGRFPGATTVLCDGTLIAGNLHFQNPALHTLLLSDVLERRAPMEGELLLVMHDDAKPDWQERIRDAYPDIEILAEGRLNLNTRFDGKDQTTFHFAHIVFKE